MDKNQQTHSNSGVVNTKSGNRVLGFDLNSPISSLKKDQLKPEPADNDIDEADIEENAALEEQAGAELLDEDTGPLAQGEEQQAEEEIELSPFESLLQDLDLSIEEDHILHDFLRIARSLLEVIEKENSCLENHELPDFIYCNTQKIRLLRDAENIQNSVMKIDKWTKDSRFVAILEELKSRLQRNEYLLKIHFEAMGDVVELIKRRAVALEADGTYTASDFAPCGDEEEKNELK